MQSRNFQNGIALGKQTPDTHIMRRTAGVFGDMPPCGLAPRALRPPRHRTNNQLVLIIILLY